jgi:hypothetical protein
MSGTGYGAVALGVPSEGLPCGGEGADLVWFCVHHKSVWWVAVPRHVLRRLRRCWSGGVRASSARPIEAPVIGLSRYCIVAVDLQECHQHWMYCTHLGGGTGHA